MFRGGARRCTYFPARSVARRHIATRRIGATKPPLVDPRSDPLLPVPRFSRVILAEKPSVARDLGRVLGIKEPKEGYLAGVSEGRSTAITWAYGHIVDWTDAEGKANSLRWSLKNLPILPTSFQLILKPGTVNAKPREQFRVIRSLMQNTDEIICATDAGREGELIFRLIYELAGATAPFKRLWISSQTDRAVKEGFSSLRTSAEFDPLYRSAWCRKAADWIVGINATQAYTVARKGLNTLNPLGRVQAPVLKMIVQRCKERMDFKKEPYWEVSLQCQVHGVTFAARFTKTPKSSAVENRFLTEAEAKNLAAKLDNEATVAEFSQKRRVDKSPRLYDLADLQKDANRRFGWTAGFTLATLQSLYELHKVVTYPRTGSRYLPEGMESTVAQVLEVVAPASLRPLVVKEKMKATNKNVFNDLKVTDHYAIIPTDQRPMTMKPQERALYSLIVSRFLSAFLPDVQRQVTEVLLDNKGQLFLGSTNQITVLGWRQAFPEVKKHLDNIAKAAKAKKSAAASSDDAADDNQALDKVDMSKTEIDIDEEPKAHVAIPVLKNGDKVAIVGPPIITQDETKPPPFYTDASIIHMMETAGELLEDETEREALKDKGIGTPSTRAAIIEKLLESSYIERDGPHLKATSRGTALIALLGDDPLASPQLTGQWESRLSKIEKLPAESKQEAEHFLEDIRAFTEELVARAKARAAAAKAAANEPPGAPVRDALRFFISPDRTEPINVGQPIIECPMCKVGQIREYGKTYRCTISSPRGVRFNQRCFWVARTLHGVDITEEQIAKVLTTGQSDLIHGFKGKAENSAPYSGYVTCDFATGQVRIRGEKTKPFSPGASSSYFARKSWRRKPTSSTPPPTHHF